MESAGHIQWYPGHMSKTKRGIKQSMPQVDILVEIADARIPHSSRNPDLDVLAAGKPRIVLLNKADIADPAATKAWIQGLRANGAGALSVDCKSGTGLNDFFPLVKKILEEKIKLWNQKGMTGRQIRMMVAGVPNSGKSSFINRISKGGRAKVEDRPGVTRSNQWYSAGDMLMMDTPGVLWPKFDNQQLARNLAYTGAIRDEILDAETLACGLLDVLAQRYMPLVCARYKLDSNVEYTDAYDLLSLIGRKRGMVISGGEIDTERAAVMLLDEFRGGVIGRITLEHVTEI